MHMKYRQPLADILRHYEMILHHIDDQIYGHLLLKTWGINPSEKEAIIEEREALRYLVDCQIMIAHEKNAIKPEIHVVNRCFERHLRFLETVHRCHAFNVNKHRSVLVRKAYKACRHYLFKFSLPAWVAKLPEEIPTFENKYPDFPFNR